MSDEKPTIREIASAYSGTSFWNWLDPWPSPHREPAEPYGLAELRGQPDPEQLTGAKWITQDYGEESYTLGILTGDPEDGAFVANLPVTIPILLDAIAKLADACGAQQRLITKAHKLARECGRELYDTFGADGKAREAMAFAECGKVAAASKETT